MLRSDDLHFSYGEREILRGVHLSLAAGELVAILGVNGSGKSTLLRNLNGILKPQRGTVLVDGRELSAMSKRETAGKMGYLPQKSNGAACTVFEAVMLGRTPHLRWNIGGRDMEVVEQAIERLGLSGHARRLTTELSGGELQKVMIARALAQEPGVLLLDEPINHLDIKNQLETMTTLRRLSRELGLLVVVVMHDLGLAVRFADRFIFLHEGRVFACGGREVVTPENIRAVYQMEASVHQVDGIPVVVARGW